MKKGIRKDKIIACFFIAFLTFLQFLGCQSTPIPTTEMKGPLYVGEGGKNLRFTVLQPIGINLEKNEQWLLTYIQGTLTNDFKTYSAMTVLDRQNLDKILENQNLAASGYFSDDDFISIGNLTNAQYILVGNLKKIEYNNFVIDFSISDTATGEIKATFSPTMCSYDDLQNLTVVNKAAEELLVKMGIELTELGKTKLHNTGISNIGAEIALSKGIEAQKNGNIGQALSYYYNAVSFEPNLTEAKNRLSIISNNVSTGNIGVNARNAIAYRNAWKKVLDECDVFLTEHFPFDIIYDSKLIQLGGINYYDESVNLKMDIQVKPTELFNMIKDVLKGLNKTGKKDEWGFTTWPFNSNEKSIEYYMDLLNNPDKINQKSVSNQPIAGFEPVDKLNETAGGNAVSNIFFNLGSYNIISTSVIAYGKNMNVGIVLINDNGEIISTISANIFGQAGTLKQERRYYYSIAHSGMVSTISFKPTAKKFTVIFPGVDVNKITDNTIVKIISVNGRNSESVGMEGYIKITNGKL
jgi:hypothetical protein